MFTIPQKPNSFWQSWLYDQTLKVAPFIALYDALGTPENLQPKPLKMMVGRPRFPFEKVLLRGPANFR